MDYFDFKQFRVYQDKSPFKVGTDSVLLGAWTDISHAEHILDIGTGTGLLALMLAQRTEVSITALEPDSSSFMQAQENIDISPWESRITVINKRVQDFNPGLTFDLIVSNPPYFRQSLVNNDQHLAKARHDLDLTGTDLLTAARRLIAPGGAFCLVLPYTEASIFIAEAADYDLYCNKILKVKPLPSAPVKRMLMEFGAEKKELHQSFLTIERARHKYTGDYKKLTRDFYPAF
ncbi:MAG: methyltransferase [Bacteroidales bacterium]|nr:methyltransferase [Bacteroidales bacterium]